MNSKYDQYLRKLSIAKTKLGLDKTPSRFILIITCAAFPLLFVFEAPGWAYILTIINLITLDKTAFAEWAARYMLTAFEIHTAINEDKKAS